SQYDACLQAEFSPRIIAPAMERGWHDTMWQADGKLSPDIADLNGRVIMAARTLSGPVVPLAMLLLIALGLSACTPAEKNVALGTLERDRIVLTATANEIVTQLPVAEGSHVQAGQLLV